jgi:hypothetical protein
MRTICILSVGLLLLGLTACQCVEVCGPCGTRCVTRPALCCPQPCYPVTGGGPGLASPDDPLLQTKVAKVDWDELMISEVLADLKAKTGVEVFTDMTVWSKHYDQMRVTLHAEDVTVDEVLGVVFAPFDFTWKTEDGRVVVRPKDAAGP